MKRNKIYIGFISTVLILLGVFMLQAPALVQAASAQAEEYCKDAYDNPAQQVACQSVYDAAVDGKSEQEVCSSSTFNTDQGKQFCSEIYKTVSDEAGSGGEIEAGSCVSSTPLAWALCPAVELMNNATSALDNIINSLLSVGSPGQSDNPNQIFCDRDTKRDNGDEALKGCRAYHKAWASFRNIALGLVVVAALIIIISEMSNLEIFDAYTLKKVLPRLLIAALAITLSWQLMQFFVTLSNALGFGVRFLIYQPFLQAGFDSTSFSAGSILSIVVVEGVALKLLQVGGLLSLAATGALAALIAFLVLILRQILIIMLAILAPLAIVMYILPNTQNMFKLWWDSFAKALMMFPIIAAFIALGRVFAAVSSSSSDNPVGEIIGFIAYFAPYFLIPLTFRFAGGALATIGGFVNDRGRGGFDRLRNYRAQKTQQNLQGAADRMREGRVFKHAPDNSRRARLNSASRSAAILASGRAGANPMQMRARMGALAEEDSGAELRKYMEENNAWQAIKGDEENLHAASKFAGGGYSEQDQRNYFRGLGRSEADVDRGVAMIRRARESAPAGVFAEAVAATVPGTGPGNKEGGVDDWLETVVDATGDSGNRRARTLVAGMQGAKQSGRGSDMANASFGTMMGATTMMANAQKQYGKDSQEYRDAKANAKAMIIKDGLEKKGVAATLGDRGYAVDQVMPFIKGRLQDSHQKMAVATASGDKDRIRMAKSEVAQRYAELASVKQRMDMAAPEIATKFATELYGAEINGRTVDGHIQDFQNTGDADFLRYRDDFDAKIQRRSRAGGAGVDPAQLEQIAAAGGVAPEQEQ